MRRTAVRCGLNKTPTTLSGDFALMKWRIPFFFAIFNLASCYKDHFYVGQEQIDRNFLASSHVLTPDPRQEHPPQGERLLVSWDFPGSIFKKQLELQLIVLFWDETQQVIRQPIERKRDFTTFFFPKEKRILTYLVQAVSKEGNIEGKWEHQFWTKLIEIGEAGDRFVPASSSSAAVSSQDKQGSVIESP